MPFNAIEHLIKTNNLQGNETAPNVCNATALVHCMIGVKHDELCIVETCKKYTVIPRGKSLKVI